VAEVMGYIKGKSAIAVARQFGGRQRNFVTAQAHQEVNLSSCKTENNGAQSIP
jgi:hypothetical protein